MFSVRFSDSPERVPGVRKGVRRGPVGPPGPPGVSSPVLEEGGPSLVDCMGLYGDCMVVLKVSSPAPFQPDSLALRSGRVGRRRRLGSAGSRGQNDGKVGR